MYGFIDACMNGHFEIVRLLKAHPRTNVLGDVHLYGRAGNSPLFLALENRHLSVVALLLTDSRINPVVSIIGDVVFIGILRSLNPFSMTLADL